MNYHYYLVVDEYHIENGNDRIFMYMTSRIVDTAKAKGHISISKAKFDYLKSIGVQEI